MIRVRHLLHNLLLAGTILIDYNGLRQRLTQKIAGNSIIPLQAKLMGLLDTKQDMIQKSVFASHYNKFSSWGLK